ncbi:MAG TPA: polymer-forming cytoskeletal protein [Candidatus Binatia bacterium]|nr:polymer-forming cytoskeletal protein [Candidatus Binatia bacterium]
MAEKADNGKPSSVQGAPRTVLFPNSSVSGKLSYNLPVRIDSRFTGEIKAGDLLVVGANAQVDAHISARHLQVEGKLAGNVYVIGCFEIMPGGHFQGEFKAGELKVHPGAVCEGKGKVVGPADEMDQVPAGPSSP